MSGDQWYAIAEEAIDYLAPFGPVILMGVENASRQLGRRVDRGRFVNAKSVYALLKATFERNGHSRGHQLLEAFLREPDTYRDEIVRLISNEANSAPDALGRKLAAITDRLREKG